MLRFKKRIVSAVVATLAFLQGMPMTNATASDVNSDAINNVSNVNVELSVEPKVQAGINQTIPEAGWIVSFAYPRSFYDENGQEAWVPENTPIYLLQSLPTIYTKRFRIYVPDITTDSVYYFDIKSHQQDVYPLTIESEDGLVLGDLAKDKKINCFDMVLMRRLLIDTEYSDEEKALADLNGDAEISVADAVLMQGFILGRIQKFYSDDD